MSWADQTQLKEQGRVIEQNLLDSITQLLNQINALNVRLTAAEAAIKSLQKTQGGQ